MNNTRGVPTVTLIDEAYSKVVEHCQIGHNGGIPLMKSLTSLSAKGFDVVNISLFIRQNDEFDDSPTATVILHNSKYHAIVYPNGFTCFGYYSNMYESQIINFMNTIIRDEE